MAAFNITTFTLMQFDAKYQVGNVMLLTCLCKIS